ncbi:MAG: hypothetical protein GC179_30700 [Anaerolineaceae bacterium]|nr:hypothetical protein [Anaerolineaceae bacterium]
MTTQKIIQPFNAPPIFLAMQILHMRDADVAAALGVTAGTIQHARQGNRPGCRAKWLIIITEAVAANLTRYEHEHPECHVESPKMLQITWKLIELQQSINATFDEESRKKACEYLENLQNKERKRKCKAA